MKITKEDKDTIATMTALVMLAFGVVLTAAGFIVTPVGQIDDSVLYVLGQCLLYSGSIFGISIYTRRRLDDIETTVRRHAHLEDDEEPKEDIESNTL